MGKYENLSVGDIVFVGPSVVNHAFIGGIDHFNEAGEPFVVPRSPLDESRYLFEQDAIKLTVLEPNPKDPFEPDATALKWTEDLLATVSDPAKWGVPDSGNEYIIDKRQKVLNYTGGGDENHHWHTRTIKTFSKFGYITVDARADFIIGVPYPVREEDMPPGVRVFVHNTLNEG